MPSVCYLSLFLFKVNVVGNQARSSDYEATEATHILKKYTGGRTFYRTFTHRLLHLASDLGEKL